MDGVLIDSESFYKERKRNFLAESGVHFDDETALGFIGLTFQDALAHFFKGEAWEKAVKGYEAYRETHKPDFKALLDPEAGDLLEALKKRGMKLAVASSSPIHTIQEVMEVSGWDKYFDLLISGDEFVRSKPDPEIYLTALARLGVKSEEAVVVEDSPHGITAAKKAGLTVVVKVDPRFDLDRSQGDYQVLHLKEVMPLLLSEGFAE